MDLFRAVQVFVTVVDSGSFVAAAALLDTSNAAISRQVAALESHFGVRLLHRTTRRLSLSEPGQALYQRGQQILHDVAEMEAVVGQHTAMPSGVLRISAPLSFGIHTLSRLLPEFHARYPKLRLDIDLTDRVVDLAHDGLDIALRIARAPSQNLIARKIAPIQMIICASPSYLVKHGEPATPQALSDHEVLSYSYLSSGDNWVLLNAAGAETTVRVSPSIHATNGDLLRELALAGGGIIVQPDFILADDIASGMLVPLLQDWRMGDFSLYAVYLSRKFLSVKVRVFIDYLTETIGRSSGS
ncbi:LysR family transcriptional regulator [Martelella sp. HB161492]|uniref:LysR family transcriptional regulator n=1 Tax=Martelella sp. HB161492 TaxID=2720726 RepID=UPI0015907997|nr:LysR family transcriptional regulator [Martelella sp. HB161492]